MKAAIVALSLLVAALPAAAASRIQRGAELFDASGCRHCHTIDQTGGHMGPDLSNVGSVLTQNGIRKQIMNGGKQMPPFGHVLDRKEIKDLVAYLHSRHTGPAK